MLHIKYKTFPLLPLKERPKISLLKLDKGARSHPWARRRVAAGQGQVREILHPCPTSYMRFSTTSGFKDIGKTDPWGLRVLYLLFHASVCGDLYRFGNYTRRAQLGSRGFVAKYAIDCAFWRRSWCIFEGEGRCGIDCDQAVRQGEDRVR